MNPSNKNIILSIIKSLPIAAAALSLSNCGTTGDTVKATKTDGYQPNHGPFDSNGNYVENWADDAPKRQYVASKTTTKEPDTSSSSADTDTEPETKSGLFGSSPKAEPTPEPTTPEPSYVATPTPTPAPSYTPSKPATTTPSKSSYTPPKVTPKPTAKPTPKVTAKPTPTKPTKPTAKKITPKAKPPILHTVGKGDTLYGLARKYGASVTAIQTANGLSGSSISLGQRLIIPRK